MQQKIRKQLGKLLCQWRCSNQVCIGSRVKGQAPKFPGAKRRAIVRMSQVSNSGGEHKYHVRDRNKVKVQASVSN